MRYVKHRALIAAGATLALIVASSCGGSKQSPKAQIQPGSSANLSTSSDGSPCKSAKDCPAVELEFKWISSFQLDGETLLGKPGALADWRFAAVAPAGANREIKTKVYHYPKEATATDGDGYVQLTWTPSTEQNSSQPIFMLGRDMTRCLMLESEDFCNDFTKMKNDYDKTRNVNWSIRVNAQSIAAGVAAVQTTAGGQVINTNTGATASGMDQNAIAALITGLGGLATGNTSATSSLMNTLLSGTLGASGSSAVGGLFTNLIGSATSAASSGSTCSSGTCGN